MSKSPAFFQVLRHVYRHMWMTCNTSKERRELPGTRQDDHICFHQVCACFSPTLYPSATGTRSPGSLSNLFKARKQLVGRVGGLNLGLLSSCHSVVTSYNLCHLRSEPKWRLYFWTCSWFFTVITAVGLIFCASRKGIMLSSADPSFSCA